MISRNSFLVLYQSTAKCMHILKSCTKQMEMTYSHQTYFWNWKLQRVFSVFCNLTISYSCHRLCFFTEKKQRSWPNFGFSCKATWDEFILFFSTRRKDLRNSKSGSQYLDSSRRVPFSSLSHASLYDRNAISNSYPFILVRLEVSSCNTFYRRTDSSVNIKLWWGTALQLA